MSRIRNTHSCKVGRKVLQRLALFAYSAENSSGFRARPGGQPSEESLRSPSGLQVARWGYTD